MEPHPDLEQLTTPIVCHGPTTTTVNVARIGDLVTLYINADPPAAAMTPAEARKLALALLWRARNIDGQEFSFNDTFKDSRG